VGFGYLGLHLTFEKGGEKIKYQKMNVNLLTKQIRMKINAPILSKERQNPMKAKTTINGVW